MRKLILQVQMTINGYVTGPNGDEDLDTWNNSGDPVFADDKKFEQWINELLDSIDTIIFGRNMTDSFITFWTTLANKPDEKYCYFAKKLIEKEKIVFSKTLQESKWQGTEIRAGNLKEEIMKLKSKPGKNIIVYGGPTFVASLIKENLIDEYNLSINPTVVNGGKSIFNGLPSIKNFTLVNSIAFPCGVTILTYHPI